MNDLNETQKAYIAGFFDGEGCISISKYQGKNNRTPVFQLQVVVAQKTDAMDELCELTGSGIVFGHKHQNGNQYRQWRLSPHESVEFLSAILPYLRIKAQEAEIAIEFQTKQGHKNTGIGYTVPQELINEKERYYLSLRAIKGSAGGNRKRGKGRE